MGKKKKTEVPTTLESQNFSVPPSGNVQQLPAASTPAPAPQVSGVVTQGLAQSQTTQPPPGPPLSGMEISGTTSQEKSACQTSIQEKLPSAQGLPVPPKSQITTLPGMPPPQGPETQERTVLVTGIQAVKTQDNQQAAGQSGSSIFQQESQEPKNQSPLPQPLPSGKQESQIPEATLPSRAACPPEKTSSSTEPKVLEKMLQQSETTLQGAPTQIKPLEKSLLVHPQGKTASMPVEKQADQQRTQGPKEPIPLPEIQPIEKLALQKGIESLEKLIPHSSEKPANVLPNQVPQSLVTQSTEKLNTQQNGQSIEKLLQPTKGSKSQILENSSQSSVQQPQPTQSPVKQPQPPQSAQPLVKQAQPQQSDQPLVKQVQPPQSAQPLVKQPQPAQTPVKQPQSQQSVQAPVKQLQQTVQSLSLKEIILPADKSPQSPVEKLSQHTEQPLDKLLLFSQQLVQSSSQPSEREVIQLPEKPTAQPPDKQQQLSGKIPPQATPPGKSTLPQKVSVTEKLAPATPSQPIVQTSSSIIPESPASQDNQPPAALLQSSKPPPAPKRQTASTPLSNISSTAQTVIPIQDIETLSSTSQYDHNMPVNPEISQINAPTDDKTSTIEKVVKKTQPDKVQASKQDKEKPAPNKNDKITNKQKTSSNVQDVISEDKSSIQKSTKDQKASTNKLNSPNDNANNTHTPEIATGKTEITPKLSNKTEDKFAAKAPEKVLVSKTSDNKNEKPSFNKNAENKQNVKLVPKTATAKSDNFDKIQNSQSDKCDSTTTKSESKLHEKSSETKPSNKSEKKVSEKSEKEDNTSTSIKSDKAENKVTNSTEEKSSVQSKTTDTKAVENKTNAKSSATNKTGAIKPETAQRKAKPSNSNKQEKKITQPDKAGDKTFAQPAPNKSDRTQKSNEKTAIGNKTTTDKEDKGPEKAQGKESEKASSVACDTKAVKKDEPESKVIKDESSSKTDTTQSPKIASAKENLAAEIVDVKDDNTVTGDAIKKKKKRGKRGRGKKAAAVTEVGGNESTTSTSQNAKKTEGTGSSIPPNTGGNAQETKPPTGESSVRKKNKKNKKKVQSSLEENNVNENPKTKAMKPDEVTTTTQEKKKNFNYTT